MTDPTPLDAAHAAMTAAPDDDAARLRYYARLADAELVLMLAEEAAGDTLAPRVFPLDDGPVVLAFDGEDRLAAFADGPVPYAALPGRVIAAQLAGQGIGLGVNLGHPTAFLVAPAAVDWLAATLDHAPTAASARPVAFRNPGALPPALLSGLAERLAPAAGLAQVAVLAAADYADGRRGHMLAFLDAAPDAHAPLARAAAEALTFSGLEAGEMDVTFLAAAEPAAAAILRAGLRLDLAPLPVPPADPAPQPPGMNRPPRLR